MTQNSKSQQFAFAMVIMLFFMWGFVHNLDPVLIPHLKRSFSLSTVQASLVDSAVFIAYFVMAFPAGILMKKYGYKAGILCGLTLFAIGSYLFIPAANTQLYIFFLIALFIIACGLTILETAANPYATLLGDPEKATQRLNMAQSFNGLAATLAPIIGAKIIMAEGYSDAELQLMSESARNAALAAEASTVKLPYFVLGTIIVIIGIIFAFIKLPEIKEETADKPASLTDILKIKHLRGAVITQFFYVGAQVCVLSFFILFAVEVLDMSNKEAAAYAGYGVGFAFMVGRFIGTYLMKFIDPAKLLAIYALINIVLSLFVMFGSGISLIYAIIAIAFFMSIMFPTIFSLGIKNLGPNVKYGSSLIIMSIVGGAILPIAFGYISDLFSNIQYSYVVPLICFIIVFLYGSSGHKIAENKY
ncbi:L-fucose:H+ symporter permease [Pseudopedobacter beijingensis]|uniref:L-fucose:H+ symporter permease n=1 Tax=Pseudopedobacter beijingensis TaxID=1207056 RepID=A0ABW4I6N4_9SPHI